MNIIANNCVGARCYQIVKQQFQNPFMWSIVLPQEFCILVQNFNALNFENVDVFQQYFEPFKDNVLGLIIDNKIKVLFTHHKNDDNAKQPQRQGINLFYCDMKKYLIDEWHKRTKRMKQIPPHFLGVVTGLWTDNDIMKFIKLKTPFKKSLIVHDKKYLKFSTKNFKICYVKSNLDTLQTAQQFINVCHKTNYTL